MNAFRFLSVLGILLALTATASAGPAVTSGLMAYYSFDNANDLGNDDSKVVGGYDGAVAGDVVYTTAAKSGGAVNITNNYNAQATPAEHAYSWIALPGSTMNPNGMTSYSFAGWFKPSFENMTTNQMFFSGWSVNGTSPNAASTQFQIRFDNPWVTRLRLNNTSVPATRFVSADVSNPVPSTDWIHWAFTYDQTAGVNIYANGANVYSGSAGGNTMGSWMYAAYLGAAPNDLSNGFGGTMDEVYMFNRVLTPTEVGTLASVPEPSSIALLIAAGLSALAYCWRKR
jgi:hypothetical protein